MGVEFLEFNLGFEAVLGFHHHIHQFVPVGVPFFNAPEVTGAAFVVDNERHNVVAQTFLEHKQSAHATVAVLEGEDLLEADVKIQNMIPFDFSLALVACDQFSHTRMDLPCRQELAIPGAGCNRPVLAGAHLLPILVHCAGHQDLMEFADELLGQGFHHVVKDIVHAMNVVQHLDHIGDLQGLEGFPNLALFEDGFHLLTG